MKDLNEKLIKIQTELKTKKSRKNNFGNYYYRSAEDILEAVKPFLIKHTVSVRIKEQLIDTNIIKSTAIITDGLNEIKASAIVGIDMNQKGMQMSYVFWVPVHKNYYEVEVAILVYYLWDLIQHGGVYVEKKLLLDCVNHWTLYQNQDYLLYLVNH